MKKSRIEGIDNLIRSTTISHPGKLVEKSTKVLLEMPVSLKKEMSIYCAIKGITLKDFMTRAVEKELISI
ncbi:hypothetical protein EZS27_028232 [termite gut metagenome]|uniref:Uncharacterized protein n=1 Tax=termite gut metagenome TaxID=433724 RepID=A0A5J4QMS1_9ZZZZ